ncbi:hypothetical protein BDZ89DRAFT_1071884 [Hymenopellis radicata]|nr:hypothetical protein BDZ89DRAFT_1071884 [Hymenopellis radicata]
MCFISYTSTRYKACGTTKPTSKQIVRCRTYHAFKAAVDARQASYSDLPKSCDPRIIPPHNNVVTDNGRCQRDCPYGRSPMYPRCQQFHIRTDSDSEFISISPSPSPASTHGPYL